MRKTMIVSKAFRPTGTGSVPTVPGDEFEATPAQARVFKALGWLQEMPAKTRTVRGMRTRALSAAVDAVPAPAAARAQTAAESEAPAGQDEAAHAGDALEP